MENENSPDKNPAHKYRLRAVNQIKQPVRFAKKEQTTRQPTVKKEPISPTRGQHSPEQKETHEQWLNNLPDFDKKKKVNQIKQSLIKIHEKFDWFTTTSSKVSVLETVACAIYAMKFEHKTLVEAANTFKLSRTTLESMYSKYKKEGTTMPVYSRCNIKLPSENKGLQDKSKETRIMSKHELEIFRKRIKDNFNNGNPCSTKDLIDLAKQIVRKRSKMTPPGTMDPVDRVTNNFIQNFKYNNKDILPYLVSVSRKMLDPKSRNEIGTKMLINGNLLIRTRTAEEEPDLSDSSTDSCESFEDNYGDEGFEVIRTEVIDEGVVEFKEVILEEMPSHRNVSSESMIRVERLDEHDEYEQEIEHDSAEDSYVELQGGHTAAMHNGNLLLVVNNVDDDCDLSNSSTDTCESFETEVRTEYLDEDFNDAKELQRQYFTMAGENENVTYLGS